MGDERLCLVGALGWLRLLPYGHMLRRKLEVIRAFIKPLTFAFEEMSDSHVETV